MYNGLICFINDNKLLYDYQVGFQKGKSTYMAMVILIEKISEAWDRGDCVIGVFLDFFKRHLIPLITKFSYKNYKYMVSKYLTKMVWELSHRKDSICNT